MTSSSILRGDADKADVWGNSPLHLAATNNHMNCVSFLVNFGVNLWTLDNEQRSVIDVAAMKGNQDIVKYLDAEIARQVSCCSYPILKRLLHNASLTDCFFSSADRSTFLTQL